MLRMMSFVNEQQVSTTQYEMRLANPQPLLELVCYLNFIKGYSSCIENILCWCPVAFYEIIYI